MQKSRIIETNNTPFKGGTCNAYNNTVLGFRDVAFFVERRLLHYANHHHETVLPTMIMADSGFTTAT